jgi:predicted DNA binding CopG/RHH family protein
MSKDSKSDINKNLDEDTECKDLEERLYQAIKDLNLPVKEVTEKDLEDWD